MAKLFLERVTSALLTIFGASIIAFIVLRALPTDPARLIAGPFATDDVLANVRMQMGLDQPLVLQYVDYVVNFFTGDWGYSYGAGQPVLPLITARLPASVELALFAFISAFAAAVLLTVLVNFSGSRILDGVLRMVSFVSVGVPPFWISLLLLMVFFERLGWFPGPVGRGPAPANPITGLYTIDYLLAGNIQAAGTSLWHLALPGLALALGSFGYLVRLLRANLLDIVHEPFVTVLHAKGVAPVSTHFRHILPNAFLPTLTAGGLILAQLIGGSVLVEQIFTWPGIGTLVIDGITRQDYAVVQSFILLSAVIYIVVNLVVDLLYGYVDPRVRRS